MGFDFAINKLKFCDIESHSLQTSDNNINLKHEENNIFLGQVCKH